MKSITESLKNKANKKVYIQQAKQYKSVYPPNKVLSNALGIDPSSRLGQLRTNFSTEDIKNENYTRVLQNLVIFLGLKYYYPDRCTREEMLDIAFRKPVMPEGCPNIEEYSNLKECYDLLRNKISFDLTNETINTALSLSYIVNAFLFKVDILQEEPRDFNKDTLCTKVYGSEVLENIRETVLRVFDYMEAKQVNLFAEKIGKGVAKTVDYERIYMILDTAYVTIDAKGSSNFTGENTQISMIMSYLMGLESSFSQEFQKVTTLCCYYPREKQFCEIAISDISEEVIQKAKDFLDGNNVQLKNVQKKDFPVPQLVDLATKVPPVQTQTHSVPPVQTQTHSVPPVQTEKSVEVPKVDESKKEKKEIEVVKEMSVTVDKVKQLEEEIYQKEVEKGIAEKEVSRLKEKEEKLRHSIQVLENEEEIIGANIQTFISKQKDQMVNIAFNGLVANKLVTAAANWQVEEIEKNEEKAFQQLNELKAEELTEEELLSYLCEMVKEVRPTYKDYDILNIAICITQGFITVFSGEPGSGKTSICNIFAEIFGLNTFNDELRRSDELEAEEKIKIFDLDMNRYIPISVERGWTSKRDFIGYFNPLTKNFDRSNRKIFDALKTLHREKEKNIKNFPLFVLLDEANLSPMEYYWADFMNVCDEIDSNSCVNLSENHIFGIPETLRFLATINNDHTTEMLSPRLIDRSWIVRLPQNKGETINKKLDLSKIKRISWQSIEDTFIPKEIGPIPENTLNVLKEVSAVFAEERVRFSPRTKIAMKRYIATATPIFAKMGESPESAEMIALDYAIAQRVLPKIMGSGENFRSMLEKVKNICKEKQLVVSTDILEGILKNGDNQMKYYRYF